MEPEVIINVEHLTKDYGYGRGVFDVSIKVHKGECYGYLGPNGAGKSTTIRHIMGFSKTSVGKVQIYGQETFGNTEKILENVGYLPGEPALPGWEFIHMMEEMRGNKNEEMLNHLIDIFKFDPSMPIKEMSLGDKRKLAVVSAFMNDPDVLILDEPTSGLDPIMQKVFIDFVIEEKKRGKTILLSSHIFSEVDATCDTISIIKDGKHVSTFKANDLKNSEKQTYILYFLNKENLDLYIEKGKEFNVKNINEHSLTAEVEFNKKDYKLFFESLSGIKVKQFVEFYKEEKEFGGLSGVRGNSK